MFLQKPRIPVLFAARTPLRGGWHRMRCPDGSLLVDRFGLFLQMVAPPARIGSPGADVSLVSVSFVCCFWGPGLRPDFGRGSFAGRQNSGPGRRTPGFGHGSGVAPTSRLPSLP